MFKVYVTIPFGVDDTLYCAYSEIEHANIEEAKKEKQEADKDERVIYSVIEEI